MHHTVVQSAMGGTHLHVPQTIFQHTMSPQNINQQNESQWLRMPQVPPMSMPWSVPSFQQPDLVRFTGEKSPQPFEVLVHQKRKLETPDIVNTRPTKQFITEEKMAQHFKGLHISNNVFDTQESMPYISTVNNAKNIPKCSNVDLNCSNSLDLNTNTSEPRLIISEEIKNLQKEPILPSSLLSKLERRSMALVLWEPPSKHLRMLPIPNDTQIPNNSSDNNNNGSNSNTVNNNNNNNNNNESIPNLNETMDVNINDPNVELMDL